MQIIHPSFMDPLFFFYEKQKQEYAKTGEREGGEIQLKYMVCQHKNSQMKPVTAR